MQCAAIQASHDIFRQIGGRQSLAIADHNLARLQQYKGNYASAIAIYREVLTTYRRLGDLQHEAYAHADIGTAYRCDGLFDEAMAHYEKAASAAGKAARPVCARRGPVRNGRSALRGRSRLDAAREKYEQAEKLASEIESLYLRAKALSGIAGNHPARQRDRRQRRSTGERRWTSSRRSGSLKRPLSTCACRPST